MLCKISRSLMSIKFQDFHTQQFDYSNESHPTFILKYACQSKDIRGEVRQLRLHGQLVYTLRCDPVSKVGKLCRPTRILNNRHHRSQETITIFYSKNHFTILFHTLPPTLQQVPCSNKLKWESNSCIFLSTPSFGNEHSKITTEVIESIILWFEHWWLCHTPMRITCLCVCVNFESTFDMHL